jgi:GTP-binding protein EngB required for normal cell division
MAENEIEQLRRYSRAKQDVVDAIRSGKNALKRSGLSEKEEQFQTLLVKLAEDRFNLAVVGQFKRGKSSLMNAIIGRDLLPTGLLPLTSAITTLCYGPEERALLRRQGWVLDQEIALDELVDYVTERGNPGNEKGLIEARVELPVPFLRRGLYFIDTPGVGSANQANTETTYQFLPETDAVILVTSVEAPLSAVENTLMQDIRGEVSKLFIVVNKIDLLNDRERAPVIDYIRSGIAKILQTDDIRIFPVSSRMGLQAKQRRDADLLLQSGLGVFESEMTRFLVEDKSRLFLVSIIERALEILGLVTSTLERIDSNQNIPNDIHSDSASLKAVQSRLQSLHTAFLKNKLLAAEEYEELPDLMQTGQPPRLIKKAIEYQKTKTKSDDSELVSSQRTCPICEAQSAAVFDFFAGWQYALAASPEARREFTAARGFCHIHTWQFQRIASPQGISEGYAPLIEQAQSVLKHLNGSPTAEVLNRIQALLPDIDTCPACQVLQRVEIERVRQFIEQITHNEEREKFSHAQGLCLPHLHAVLNAHPEPAIVHLLVEEQARRLEEIFEDMHNYVLKRDALRRGLLNTNEGDAWRRALILLSGERNARVI